MGINSKTKFLPVFSEFFFAGSIVSYFEIMPNKEHGNIIFFNQKFAKFFTGFLRKFPGKGQSFHTLQRKIFQCLQAVLMGHERNIKFIPQHACRVRREGQEAGGRIGLQIQMVLRSKFLVLLKKFFSVGVGGGKFY